MKMNLPNNFDKLSWELKCAKVSEMPTRRLHSAYNPQPKRKKNLTPSTHRNAYSIEFKRQVVDWFYANKMNKSETSRQFGISRSSVYDWVLEDHELQCANGMRKRLPSVYGPTGHYPTLDELLVEYVNKMNQEKRRVGASDLIKKGLELAKQLGYNDLMAIMRHRFFST